MFIKTNSVISFFYMIKITLLLDFKYNIRSFNNNMMKN